MSTDTITVQKEEKNNSSHQVSDLRMFHNKDCLMLKYTVTLLRRRKLSLAIQLILVILHVSGLIFTMYEKFEKLFGPYNLPMTVRTIDVICSVWVVSTNILGIFAIANNPAVPDLFMYFYRHDAEKANSCKVFKGYLTIMHILNILLLVLKFYMALIYFDWSPYRYILAEDLEYYIFTLIISLILCFAEKIKGRFSTINEYFLKLLKEDSELGKKSTTIKPTDYLSSLRYILNQQNELCDQLDKFNEAFKCIILFTVINITQHFLWNFMVVIVTTNQHWDYGEGEVKIYVIVMLVINMIVAAGQAALVALVGEHLADEGKQTTKLCYSLLNKLPVQSQNETDQLIEKQLQFLLDQSKSRNVSLHAGGFFQLNWGILGSIATTVTTYSIVIIQFLLK